MPDQLSLLELLEKPRLDALFKPDQIFESDDGSLIARLTEDTRFDRKSGKVDGNGLAVCLSAFGNGPAVEGGVVAVGIEKDGRVTGCRHLSEARLQEIETAGRDRCPDGRFSTRRVNVTNDAGEDDFLILIRIYYVEGRLVSLTNDDAYCRQGDKCRRLTDSEKQEIRISKGERSFELEASTLTYPDDFREMDISNFVRRIKEEREGSEDLSSQRILQSMRLGKVVNGNFLPNNVCTLMFATDPQQVFPGAYIHFLRYNGIEAKSGSEYNVVKDRMIQGTVLEVIREAASVLDANLREFTTRRNGKFYSVPEYPRDAWYEAIVNAVCHRSYHARNSPVFIRMFDDRLTIESPGAFMPSVTPANLFHKPRNPFLMFVLREYGEVRCISEGTARIFREMQDAKLPVPEFRGTENLVSVTFRNEIANRTNSLDSEAYKVLGEAISFSLDDDEKKIVNYVMEHRQINVSDALRILSTTYWHTAKAKLTRLVTRGILDFHSTKVRDPNAYYSLRDANGR
jgi:ATP-dependent DNA helicase RecG